MQTTSRKELLIAATLQFSSPIRRLRDHSLEQIFVRILGDTEEDSGLSIPDLQSRYATVTKNGYISVADSMAVIRRLTSQRTVERVGINPECFCLSDSARNSLEAAEHRASISISEITRELFPVSTGNSSIYEDPLIEVIAKVCANVSEESASYLLRHAGQHSVDSETLDQWIDEAAGVDLRINSGILRQGIMTFLRNPDPRFQGLLWQVTEAFFITRILGIDPGGAALSRRLFDRWEFVLDANVLIALLLPSHELHETTSAVVQALRALKRPMFVLRSTLDEIERFFERELDILTRYVNSRNERWLSKTRSPFLREYARLDFPDIYQFESLYRRGGESLIQPYGFEVVKNFERLDQQIQSDFAEQLSARYSRPHRIKSVDVALHDALLLLYTMDRRSHTSLQTWALTLDTSLPRAMPLGAGEGSLAILPRDLLQWVAPAVNQANVRADIPAAFAALVRERFLPRRVLFDSGDLSLVLTTLMESRDVPDEDIERLMFKIEAEAVRVNPANAEGREVITSLLQSVISDPQSRTQSRVVEIEESAAREIELNRQVSEIALQERNQRISELMDQVLQIKGEKETNEEQHQGEIARRDERDAVRLFWIGIVLVCGLLPLVLTAFTYKFSDIRVHWSVTLLVAGLVSSGIAIVLRDSLIVWLVGEEKMYALPSRLKKFVSAE